MRLLKAFISLVNRFHWAIIGPRERRTALRNAAFVAMLLSFLWTPVIFIHLRRTQADSAERITAMTNAQAEAFSVTLARSQLLLDWLAKSLTSREASDLPDQKLADEVHDILISGRLDKLSCVGFAAIFPNRYFVRFSPNVDGSVFDTPEFPGWNELTSIETQSVPSQQSLYGPYRTPSGSLNVVLVSRFRRPQSEAMGLLAYEYSLQALLSETKVSDPEVPLVQELLDENGRHLCGTENLEARFPVRSDFEIDGKKWKLLTLPKADWFSLFPAEILYLGSLSFVILIASSYSVWWLTIKYGRLNSNLLEKTNALDAANKKILSDFEELRATQRRLAASELRTRVIYDQIAIGVALVDRNSGRFLHVNPRGCQLLATPETALQQLRLQDLLVYTDSGSSLAAIDLNAVAPGEYFAKAGSSSIIRIQLTIAQVLSREGESDRVMVVLEDITQRWQAQQELREHEERFRVLVNTLPGPLLYIDSDHCCRFANDVAVSVLERLHGNNFVHPIGRRSEEFLAPPLFTFLEPWIELALRGESLQFETTPEIEQLIGGAWIGFHTPYYRNGHIEGFFAFLVDITEQRRSETERRQLAERMAEAHRMETVGTLAGGVAHEFNNMLQVVLGHAEVLLVHLQNDAFAQENLNNIRISGRRASDLTKQLLAFARFQNSSPIQLNFADLVPVALRLLRHAVGKDIQLVWNCQQGLDDVLIDQSHLDLILANLIFNSRHALDGKGTIEITARNLPADAAAEPGLPSAGQPSVLLSVCDRGCGMTPEVQARMFDPFFTTRAIGEGTGLGLSTVYGLVIQNSGRIDVRSAPGNGTSIHMLFPACSNRNGGSGKLKKTMLADGGG
jgi:signal transduction histidine kinase